MKHEWIPNIAQYKVERNSKQRVNGYLTSKVPVQSLERGAADTVCKFSTLKLQQILEVRVPQRLSYCPKYGNVCCTRELSF